MAMKIIQNKYNQVQQYFAKNWTDKTKNGSWAEFFNKKLFSFPASLTEISRRCPDNLQLYFTNYCVISVILLVYCLITSPLLLFGILVYSILAYIIIKRNEELELFGKPMTRNQQLITISIAFIPVLYFLGLTTTFFWLVGACTFVIALHAIFHQSMKLPVDQINGVTVVAGNSGSNNNNGGGGGKLSISSISTTSNNTTSNSDDDGHPAPNPRKKTNETKNEV